MSISLIKFFKKKSRVIGAGLILFFAFSIAAPKLIVAYWSNGAKYQPYPIPASTSKRGGIQTNPDLSSKLNKINVLDYAFLQVNNHGNIYFARPEIDLSKRDITNFCQRFNHDCKGLKLNHYVGNIDAFASLENKQHTLKKIISIGGANSEKSFINAISHPRHFIDSANNTIQYFKLNGIDLDFETNAVFTKKQVEQYTNLIVKLRKKLGKQSLITIEIPADHETLHSISRKNWLIISKNAYVSIMGYEFHSYLYPPYITANNSNLYPDPNEPMIKGFYHISDDQAVRYLTYLGVPANKIILGYPAYFHAYGGVLKKNNGLYQPFKPSLTPVFGSRTGAGPYRLVPELLKSGFMPHSIMQNGKVSAVYAYNSSNREWISYEGTKSVKSKAKYVISHNLAGMMMWNIKQDAPASSKYSLLSVVYNSLKLSP